MNQPLEDYFEALARLKAGTPLRVPADSKITNDAVALEAGRGKGSIKKSRPIFADLIAAIEAAADERAQVVNKDKIALDKAKQETAEVRQALDASLAREVSLLNELYELKKQLATLTGGNVLPIRAKT